MQVNLCADEVVIITLDARTGRLSLRDTGDLAAAGRGPRFATITDTLNLNPTLLIDALFTLRITVGSMHQPLLLLVRGADDVTDYLGPRRAKSEVSWAPELSSAKHQKRRSIHICLRE